MLGKFFSKYKNYLIAAFAVFVVLTVLLIVLSSGPQRGAFNYQIF
ncbi:MAG: hypothetical protein RIG61_07585 [Deltaproteobacteria bacterium]